MAMTRCKECAVEISTKAEKCPRCGAPQKKKTSLFVWIIAIFAGFWLLGYVGLLSRSPTTAGQPDPKVAAIEAVELEYNWDKAGFGSVMEADFQITNNNAREIKDIEITCTHFAKSGTKIDSNTRVIFDKVGPKSKKNFPKFSMGFIHSQVDRSNCRITDIKLD